VVSFLLIVLLSAGEKVVEVRHTSVAPKIDGIMEDTWFAADSAGEFIQARPYEKSSPTEQTVVHLLQDESDLYIAFKCYTHNSRPVVCLGANEDYITLYIDPMRSKAIGYYFTVNISGAIDDGMVLDDGRTRDGIWDGVWFQSARIFDDYYIIEIKIPFKSIRYKKDLNEWGINFERFIAQKQETDYWTEVPLLEGNLISKYYGVLRNINPRAVGYYFEIYPEGYVRYDKYYDTEAKLKPSGSLNIKWDITPHTTLNTTVFPDFAQIESDPYTLNLSRYPIYLSERRPFFIEGSDIFRFSQMGTGTNFKPLRIFYTRKIGKSINNDLVPLIGGLKLTSKTEDLSFGLLGAWTDSLKYDTSNTEPSRRFGIFRVKKRFLTNSDLGFLFSGTMVNKDDYNYAFGLDGIYRRGYNQIALQTAFSDRNRKNGWALASGYSLFWKSFAFVSNIEIVADSFDVNDIGYVPWSGRKTFDFYNAYWKSYPKGILRDWSIGPGIKIIKEAGLNDWSKIIYFGMWPSFRNGWDFYCNIYAGPYYEADTNYLYRGIRAEFWRELARIEYGFGGYYYYGYNYNRGFLAYQGSNWLWCEYSIAPRVRVSVSSDLWVEWDTTKTICGITPEITPRVELTLTKDMNFSFFNELVLTTPRADIDSTQIFSNRIGFLFSWNFRPKSWIYVAFNDYRWQNSEGSLQFQNRIGAIKIKYLIYF